MGTYFMNTCIRRKEGKLASISDYQLKDIKLHPFTFQENETCTQVHYRTDKRSNPMIDNVSRGYPSHYRTDKRRHAHRIEESRNRNGDTEKLKEITYRSESMSQNNSQR